MDTNEIPDGADVVIMGNQPSSTLWDPDTGFVRPRTEDDEETGKKMREAAQNKMKKPATAKEKTSG